MPRLKSTIALLAATSAAALGAAPAASATCSGANLPASSLAESQIEEAMLCVINERRDGAGLRPLGPNPQLRAAGLSHSRDMVSKGYFAHTSPSGVDFMQRITHSGYTSGPRVKSWVVGENLGWGSGGLSTASALVQGWMNSPPHRAIVLHRRYRELGVAAVRGTPLNASDSDGLTVSSEFGFRSKKKRKK